MIAEGFEIRVQYILIMYYRLSIESSFNKLVNVFIEAFVRLDESLMKMEK